MAPLILLAVVVLLFGAKRLPDMARAVGQSARIFKTEIKQGAAADQPAPHQPSAPPALAPDPHPKPAEHGMPSPPSTPDGIHPPTP